MPRPKLQNGRKNLVGEKMKYLRERERMSQRDLAEKFQLMGIDFDQNVITRIETNKRCVTDIEICAIMKVFDVPSRYLLDESETGEEREAGSLKK